MRELDLRSSSYERHQCEGQKKEDWLIFTCSQCDYTRKMNWKTGEMTSSGGDKEVMHDGFFMPVGIDPKRYGESAN